MNNIKNIRKRSIGTLVVLLFVLSFSITPALLFSNYSFGSGFKNPTDEEQNLNLSTNYLFAGTSYTFNLDDFYDDTNLYKIYTGAKFQTEIFNDTTMAWSGTVLNDTVTPVDNNEIELGDPSNVNIAKGTTDSADNMKVLDDSYSTFTSTHTDGYIYETPSQWDDFTFTNGTGETIGEIETIDANYSVIRDDYFSIDDYITIIPNEDYTPLQWMPNPAGTHWSKIDEDPDSNDGETTQLVVVLDSNVIDVINYTTGDIEGGSVYKIVVRYAYKGTGPAGYDAFIDINLGGWLGYKEVTRPGVDFTAQDLEWTGLTGSQDDVDELQIRLKSRISGLNSNHFTAIWVKVYYSKLEIDLDVQVDMHVDDPGCSSIEYFKYSHKTNVSATIDLDIWNWDTTTWFEIESVDNFASFDDDSFTLGLDSDYVNSSFGVRIRFQLNTGTNDFELQIDRFRLDYLTTPAELEMTITFSFTDYNEDLLGMTVQSWQKTNISQTIIFKIWNYNTETWVQISSSSDTSFTKKEYNTESPNNFISPTGVVKLNWTGSNTTNDFELHIDYLFIQIFYKLDLVHSKSFDTNGIYRYRWCVLGSIHYTQWVVFEVVDPVPNFHAISESDLTTRWILQNATLTPVENFTDDISGSNWYLYDVSEDSFEEIPIHITNYLLDNYTDVYTETHFDVGVEDTSPDGITWDGTYFWVNGRLNQEVFKYTAGGVYTDVSFDVSGYGSSATDIYWDGTFFWILDNANDEVYQYNVAGDYTFVHWDVGGQLSYPTGITWDGTYFWVIGSNTDTVFKYTSAGVYTETSFDVSNEDIKPQGITWDGTHFWIVGEWTDEIYKYTSAGIYTGEHFDTGTEDGTPTGITWDGTHFWVVGQGHDEIYKYTKECTIFKKYQGGGYMYMQTNTTELIALQSTAYGTNYTLNSGDYFEVDFQTSSDSQINLILIKNGVVNKTLTLSQSGNTNFNRHTVQIPIDETVEFDQLRISSTFEDEDYVRIYDIKTKKYTITGDYADFYVGSYRTHSVYLTPDTYNLKISEEGRWRINENITIPATGIKQYVYTPIHTQYCRLVLFSKADPLKSLPFTDYHVKVNRSFDGIYNQFWLLDTIFYADDGTYIYIDVYDRFDSLIGSFERLASGYIDLEIEVYSLQIKNLQTQKTTIDINTTHVYPLLSGDSIYFMLSKNYYQIGYYDTNDVYKQFLIYLDSNQAYELNRSKIVFLSYTNQKGEHLYFEDYKTYINDSLIYENVFYREIGDWIKIEIKDRYDISIKNETYQVISGDNYIPIVLTKYSLKIMNQQEQFNHINITRDPNYYESGYYWSEWVAPNEIIKFSFFPGYYKINLTNNEQKSYSYYSYTLSGDDVLLISSDNVLSQVIYNIANVNTTIGNQITNVEINITNQNSEINNTIVNIEINLSNVNSTLGNLLTNIDVNILNLESDIASLYTFTNTSIWNLNNAMNTSFIYMENNIYSINQSISTLVIGIDNSISLVNATITSMFTEMNQQFIVVQSTLDYSFAFLNQTIIQLANNITENHVVLYNLIEQRANEIDSSLINVQTLINLVNNTVADESLVIQTLVNLIGANITNNHIIINNLLNLIDNNITNNNIQLVSILEVIGNNITTNHFVIQTLLDVIGNNITYNHIELLTNLNFINTTISQNQIELINRLLFINNTVNDLMFELTNQLLFLNGTIYSAVLNLSTSVEFGVDMVIGNITITYQQNEFLTELYKETMFSQLLNWSGVAYNYTLMEDRMDVWTFVNNYINQSVEIHLRYQGLIEKLVISADDFRDQWLPNEDVEYRLWSVDNEEYIDEWEELDPEDKTVNFGFYETTVPTDPRPLINAMNMLVWFTFFVIFILFIIIVLYVRFSRQKASIPIELKQYLKKKKPKKEKKNVYSDKDIYID